MYKVASDKRQSALHRGRLSDWANGEQYLTAEQRLEQMREGWRILQERCNAATGEEKKRIGLEMLALQNQLREAKKALGLIGHIAKRGWQDVFRDMCKEMLPKVQYELIVKATHREVARLEAAANEAGERAFGEKSE